MHDDSCYIITQFLTNIHTYYTIYTQHFHTASAIILRVALNKHTDINKEKAEIRLIIWSEGFYEKI